ncbi:MAG: hypothetical protein E7369_02375 [Clostridiales bacterium]|nr:hypothetical protein [Clostridiales bacterium]
MKKIETHTHCLGGSCCAIAPIKNLIDDYVTAGYDGVVLTNHLSQFEYNNYPGETHAEKIEYYYSLYTEGLEYAKQKGINLMFGSEVRVFDPYGFGEYMVYGVTKQLLMESKPLFEMTQQELFDFSCKHGLFMFQTHPYRTNVKLGDPKYLHGAEAFNGHFHHQNNNVLAKEFCDGNSLIKTSGSDYHGVGQPILGGLIVPDEVEDMQGLIKTLFLGKARIIENQEKYENYLEEYFKRKLK